MQEIVMSSDEVVEVTVEKASDGGGGKVSRRKMRNKDGGDGLVKWEKFLPKIALRVLLVEADDSTRQIIAALLRKCSYRVAAVPDGLKAWEMLKGKPESVDLILTEVDLPSISGYPLLTLIMEHDICKNIPVIMMSTEDSVNTVYKCMLKGAADYLVKPLRRNELRNLWQHVWRRQTSLAPESSPLNESVGQEKPEGASANNSISKDNYPVVPIRGDAQSSSTRQEMEGESADVQDDTPKEPIDFMGALIKRNGQCNREESIVQYESRIELDLSLRRPNASEDQSSGERPSLRPSSASAFARYVHRPLETQCSASPLIFDQTTNVAASAQRRNEASFYSTTESPGPPFSTQINSWPMKNSIQMTYPNTAYASAMAPASLSPSPSSISPHEYSSMFQPLNRKPEVLQEQDGSMEQQCSTNHIEKSQQSLQREAALTKFRMKRKDRCFEKKVRYESRKKLAEKRPRIKGQFVRQVQSIETSTQAQH